MIMENVLCNIGKDTVMETYFDKLLRMKYVYVYYNNFSKELC